MSILNTAEKRCLFLVRTHTDLNDSELSDLCVKDIKEGMLKEGYRCIHSTIVESMVDYYVANRRKLEQPS